MVLVGLGARGRYWAQVMHAESACEVVAYVDPSADAVASACTTFGERPTFASLEEALTAFDDLDALVLATPPSGREAQLRGAAERNLPVLVEKPLALDLAEAARYVTLMEEAGVPLMVGLNFRYLAVTMERMRLYRENAVGSPEFTRFTYERWRDGYRPGINRYPLTMEHPMLWEQSIHHFDLLRYVYESEPVQVACRAWNPSWSMYAHETNVSALFTFESGMSATYQGLWQSGWVTPGFEWRTDCTEGVVTQFDQFGELAYARREQAELTEVPLPAHEIWVTETAGLLRAFVRTVQEGAPLECSGRDHLGSLAMVQACIEASRDERVVHVADVLAAVPGGHLP
ncbi:Gfo/Idh/MocA family oxidoreductase [soil metagenome]